jgi:hypothetical protein
MGMSEMSMIEFVAERCLAGDRNKQDWAGGQKLHTSIVKVGAEKHAGAGVPMVFVLTDDGRRGESVVRPDLVNRPEKREIAPADIEPAVFAALVEASAQIAA